MKFKINRIIHNPISGTTELYLEGNEIVTACPGIDCEVEFPKAPPVAPDPGEGYELVPYEPDEAVDKTWEWWDNGESRWDYSRCVGATMSDGSRHGDIIYRRPTAKVCPITDERCKHLSESGTGCKIKGTELPKGRFDVCPWPSQKGV
jgi:hypothetical protein